MTGHFQNSMKLALRSSFHHARLLHRRRVVAALLAALSLQSATADSTVPEWWAHQQVLTTSPKDDYAVANLGQLKTIVRKAAQEMNEHLVGGAGTAINTLVDTWETNLAPDGAARDDYAALTVGQLKTVAAMFYQRLQQVGIAFTSPVGQPGSGVVDDYALANLGQLKTMFAFPITEDIVGLDGDDYDHDGLTNGQELALGTNPRLWDTDGDGVADGREMTEGTDPLNASSSSAELLALTFRSPLE